MNLEKSIKPISYLKSHTAEIFKNLEKDGTPLIITQNGEAKAVVQDIASYEMTQESLAMLKILALGREEVGEEKTRSVKKAFTDLRRQIKSSS